MIPAIGMAYNAARKDLQQQFHRLTLRYMLFVQSSGLWFYESDAVKNSTFLLRRFESTVAAVTAMVIFLSADCAVSFAYHSDNSANPPAIAAADLADFSICELSSRFALVFLSVKAEAVFSSLLASMMDSL